MSWLGWLPCCGPRKEKVDSGSLAESASLLNPNHQDNQSILSADPGYGTIEPAQLNQNALSGEQKSRIEEIGREVGGHMLPIHPHHRSHPSPSHHNRSHNHNRHHPLPKTNTMDSTTSSTDSSRPPSPSPSRPQTSPPGGRIRSVEDEATGVEDGGDGGDGEDGTVVRKTVFAGGLGAMRGGRRGRGRGRGKGAGSRDVSGASAGGGGGGGGGGG